MGIKIKCTTPLKKVATKKQQDFLRNNCNVLTNAAMADALNVSVTKIRNWLIEFGLKKQRVFSVYSDYKSSEQYFKHDANMVTI
jgi:hypothetical protein